MKFSIVKVLGMVAACASLCSCMVGPDYENPESEVAKWNMKAEHFSRDGGLWKEAVPADSLPKGEWWHVFNDRILDGLIKRCNENNPTLAAAFYTVEQARQSARLNEAELYPWASGDASYARTGSSKNYKQTANAGTFDRWSIGLGFTWDLDFFGRVQSMVVAEEGRAQAALDSYYNMMLVLHAEIANTYFTIRQYSSEKELLERTLQVRKEQTDFVRRRVKFNFANDLDLHRAILQENEAAAQLSAVDRSMETAINRLAILVGKTPAQFKVSYAPLSEKLPKMPRAVPSQLLERRPDVAASERAVFAANAQIGVAQAGFFPTISITANTSFQSSDIDKLINAGSFAWGVSPQIYIPIFQAGRIYAQKQVALAAHKTALENYKAKVLSAIGEVENALTTINTLNTEYDRRREVTKSSLKVQELTQKQYDLGAEDYFAVSDAQRIALLNEREQLRLLGDKYRACVALIGALGGGWTHERQPDAKDMKADIYSSVREYAPEGSSEKEKAVQSQSTENNNTSSL